MNYPPCIDSHCPVHARGAIDTILRTCVRQILRGHDLQGAIAMFEQPPPAGTPPHAKHVLPVSLLGTICEPDKRYEVTVQFNRDDIAKILAPHGESASWFRPERLMLSDAGTVNGAADWTIHDIVMDGRSQLAPYRDLPGDLFSAGMLDNHLPFDQVSADADITIAFSYRGDNPSGAAFFASLVGKPTFPEL